MSPLLIFGASRGVGLELARLARAEGRPVAALLRTQSDASALETMGVTVMRGDALDPADVARAFTAVPMGAVVVSTLSGRAPDGRFVDEVGNVNAVEAALTNAASRLVLVTSIGCGEMAPYRSEQAKAAFGATVDAKTRAEDHLRATHLAWTIVRPGGLRTGPATGRGILSTDPQMHGYIHRADVALLVGRVLRDPGTIGRALAAVDAEEARSVNPILPFPLAA